MFLISQRGRPPSCPAERGHRLPLMMGKNNRPAAVSEEKNNLKAAISQNAMKACSSHSAVGDKESLTNTLKEKIYIQRDTDSLKQILNNFDAECIFVVVINL